MFETGRVIDLILAVVVVEFVALATWPRLRGAMSLLDVASLLAPGVMLLLAARSVMTAAPISMTAAILAAAFVMHLWDLARRRKAPRDPT